MERFPLGKPRGVIFDVDETMLDNFVPELATSIHDLSGREAYRTIGEKYGYEYMTTLTTEENTAAFKAALTHSAEGGAWEILRRAGAVDGELDLRHPILKEIILMKDKLQGDLIEIHGKPIRGVDSFVPALGALGLGRKMAIASTAARSHIHSFLNKYEMKPYFPNNHIISKESVHHFKPHPEAFQKAFDTLRLPNDMIPETVAFEDSIKGIESAKAVGLFVCALTTSFSEDELKALPKDVAPDYIAYDYAEIAEQFDWPMKLAA